MKQDHVKSVSNKITVYLIRYAIEELAGWMGEEIPRSSTTAAQASESWSQVCCSVKGMNSPVGIVCLRWWSGVLIRSKPRPPFVSSMQSPSRRMVDWS